MPDPRAGGDDATPDRHGKLLDRSEGGFFAGRELDSVHRRILARF
jgi:hypothetical protein